MAANVRPARATDLEAVARIFQETYTDMERRHGREPLPPAAAPEPIYSHLLATDPEGFWVAEVEGELAGYAASIVRDALWFLSSFWVLPRWQGQGIGRQLLRRALAYGRARGARCFSVYSSREPAALGAYLRAGMYPQPPFIRLVAPVLPRPAPDAPGLVLRPLAASEEAVAALAPIDLAVRGCRRDPDHLYWLSQRDRRGFAALSAGELVGYFYVGGETSIGPLATINATLVEPLLAAALRRCAATAPYLPTVRVPGANHRALRFLLAHGFRVEDYTHFLSSAPYGRFDRYVISGGALL